ncbi:MAG: hypothetical protein AMXMBFR23_01070 [Chloroflexota bacterium]
MAVIPHPAHGVAVSPALPLRTAVARRAVPVVATIASAVVATLAVERAVSSLALRAAAGLGASTVLAPSQRAEAALLRAVVTEATVVERITTRRR